MRKLITCPDTAHLEVIEYERTELGTLIAGCSRLSRCRLECGRVCAALLDCHPALDSDSCGGPWCDDAGIVPLVIVSDTYEQALDDEART